MRVHRTLVLSGLLSCGVMLSFPRVTSAAAGCSNVTVNGTYSVQIENLSLVGTLAVVNAPPATGTNPSTPAPVAPTGGFGNHPNSLGGPTPGLGRFFFDGNGVIVGQTTAGATNVNVGTYSVNYDCTATLRLDSGQSYNAIVTGGGNGVLFIETDTAGAGVVGRMTRSSNSCPSSIGPASSFGFSLAGAQRMAAASSSGSPNSAFKPYSTLGSVQLNSDGGFSLRSWQFSNGTLQTVSSTGTYSIGNDCSVRLTFAPTATGSPSPIALRVFLVDQETGILTAQPDASKLTGSFVAQ